MKVVEGGDARLREAVGRAQGELAGDAANRPCAHGHDDGTDTVRHRVAGQHEHGPIPALLPPVTFSDIEAAMGDVPALGQHTHEVLSGLGLSAEEIEALETARVVGRLATPPGSPAHDV